MNFNKSLCVSLFLLLFFAGFAAKSFAQERARVIQEQNTQKTYSSQRIPAKNSPKIRQLSSNNTLVIQNPPPLVKKTVSSQPTNAALGSYISRVSYSAVFNQRLFFAIKDRFGIPYRYGSTGPNTYDCSGLVWSVFHDAGYDFERSSARTLWQNSEPVAGDDRYKFGTLVFFNRLGHIGIVADENGFYHASTSQGVTYSKFEGYWEKRIVGFRRFPIIK
jgi:cell wall-associated NlpC family hydrolase